MPSIGSIAATLDRCCQLKEQVGRNPVIFPLMDPLDAFYLLNPSGDLSRTQVEFEDWFRNQNLEEHSIFQGMKFRNLKIVPLLS